MPRPLVRVLTLLGVVPSAAQGRYEDELASGDEALSSGEFADTYVLALERGSGPRSPCDRTPGSPII
jgi:hypothetical protein